MRIFRRMTVRTTPMTVADFIRPDVDRVMAQLAEDRAQWALSADVRVGARLDTVFPQASA